MFVLSALFASPKKFRGRFLGPVEAVEPHYHPNHVQGQSDPDWALVDPWLAHWNLPRYQCGGANAFAVRTFIS